MSTTCLYSDVVLPTATWYEKNDINTSDMHTFIHPFASAVDPGLGESAGLGHLPNDRLQVFPGRPGRPGQGEGPRLHGPPARQPRRARTGHRCEGMETGRMRDHPRKIDSDHDSGRAGLPERGSHVHVAGAAGIEHRRRRQGHQLERAGGSGVPRQAERRKPRDGTVRRTAAPVERYRRG